MEHAPDRFADYTNEDLLSRIRAGERDLFGPLVRRFERELYGYLCRYVGDAELAADVFQNTFLAIFRKIQQYEPGRAARPYIYTIATHQAIDAMRRRSRQLDAKADPILDDEQSHRSARPLNELLEGEGHDPAVIVETNELREQVRANVNALPDLLRQTVILTYFQGLKYQDAAEVLKVPVGTVKSRLNAALTRLGIMWQPQPLDPAEKET